MLKFFFTRHELPTVTTPEALPFNIVNAAEFKDAIIPYSHMYVTSETYLHRIHLALGKELRQKLVTVSDKQTEHIQNQQNFPPNITEYNVSNITEYKALLGNKEEIDIAIINGIGADFGDNFIGLALIQRLSNLLSPAKVNFHLMQTFNQRFKEVYINNAALCATNIQVHNNVMSLQKFVDMDAYINLSGIRSYAEFATMSHCEFFKTAFSLEHILPSNYLHPLITCKPKQWEKTRQIVDSKFNDKRPIVLVHLVSYDSAKTCPADFSIKLIKSLIENGYHVISPNPINLNHPHFQDCSNISNSLEAFTALISASDCIISTGTLSLNIASAIGKPTVLLPLTQAQIRTVQHYPEILTAYSSLNKNLYLENVNQASEEDKQRIEKIWQNLSIEKLSQSIKEFQQGFKRTQTIFSKKIDAPDRIAIIIPYTIDGIEADSILNRCLEALCQVNLFDAAYLDIIDCREGKISKTEAYNQGIKTAIKKRCEFIWFLDPDQMADQMFLSNAIKRLVSDTKIAAVRGQEFDESEQSSWSGSGICFPQLTAVSESFLYETENKARHENWVPFSSIVIRTSAIAKLGLLNQELGDAFSEVDYCFELYLNNYFIIYDPELKTNQVSQNASGFYNPNDGEKNQFIDNKNFFIKWSKLTGCQDAFNLNDEIIQYIQKSINKD